MRFFKKIFDVGAPFVAVYAVCLILLPWASLHAQQSQVQVLDYELTHRVERIEKLDLDHRLTVIETNEQDAKDNALWYKLSSGGTGILLLDAIMRYLNKRNKEEETKP